MCREEPGGERVTRCPLPQPLPQRVAVPVRQEGTRGGIGQLCVKGRRDIGAVLCEGHVFVRL